MQRILVILIGLTLTWTHTASAIVTLGFDINTISNNPLFVYDNNGTPTVTDDTLNSDNTVTFTVNVDGTPVPAFTNANFDFSANLTGMTNLGYGIQLSYTGTFTVSTSSNETILTANFQNATMLMLANGIFSTPLAKAVSETPLIYTAGSALLPHLGNNKILGLNQSMNVTVENLASWAGDFDNENNPVGTGPVSFTGTGEQAETTSDFIFDGSFSGTSGVAEIPEPASLGLLLMGLLAMGNRTRKQA